MYIRLSHVANNWVYSIELQLQRNTVVGFAFLSFNFFCPNKPSFSVDRVSFIFYCYNLLISFFGIVLRIYVLCSSIVLMCMVPFAISSSS